MWILLMQCAAGEGGAPAGDVMTAPTGRRRAAVPGLVSVRRSESRQVRGGQACCANGADMFGQHVSCRRQMVIASDRLVKPLLNCDNNLNDTNHRPFRMISELVFF